MKWKFFITLLFIISFILTTPIQALAINSSFVTLVYPVRSRQLWTNGLDKLSSTFNILREKNLSSTWLFQYDALKDQQLIGTIKNNCPSCEYGLFLEVSENLATDSDVSYKIGQGQWYRPDKIFLSGYSLVDREKLINKQFEQYKNVFGHYPRSVGAWYVDPFSLKYIVDAYKVTGFVSVADQFDTDGQRYWGKPFGTPFYPQKYNTLVPANSLANKLDIVEIQWAQRQPSDSYGIGPKFSQFSLQANDYTNNGKNINYFKNLLDQYLFQKKNPFGQATVGLEVGQELFSFFDEHLRQLDTIESLKKQGQIKVLTVSQFSDWYQKSFPKLSPGMFVSDQKTTWVSTRCYRLGYQMTGNNVQIIDFRTYNSSVTSQDLLQSDQKPFLDRQTEPLIDKIALRNPIKLSSNNANFTDTSVNFDTKQIDTTASCGNTPGISNIANTVDQKSLLEWLISPLSIFKLSTINGEKVLGVQTGKNTIFGLWSGRGVGNFSLPFQTLSKFRNLTQLWDN